MKNNSRLKGFYKRNWDERQNEVKDWAGLSQEECEIITNGRPKMDQVDMFVENVIGVIGIPLGIATNFLINGKDYLVPMATDESSVIAGASNGARFAREHGGFNTTTTDPLMEGQIQIVGLNDPNGAKMRLYENKDELLAMANSQDPVLVELGGGAKDIRLRIVESSSEKMLFLHLTVNVKDAMGANAVNTMVEYLAPTVEKITGGKTVLRIIDNYAETRLARARAVFDKELLGGQHIVDNMLYGYAAGYYDTHRAAGHNKGTMNGITAVVLATGNDTRAVESGFHSYAARSGRYRALPVWEKNQDGNLVGTLEMPVPVGLIGGMTKLHPVSQACIKILGVESADELGQVLAAVGLASKCAAERALASEGIQKGHMSLHAKNIAVAAGAVGEEVGKVAEMMVSENKVRVDRAKEILNDLR